MSQYGVRIVRCAERYVVSICTAHRFVSLNAFILRQICRMTVSVIAHKSFCDFCTVTSFCNYEIIIRSVLLAIDHLLSSSRVARREASLFIIIDLPTERHSFFNGV